MSQWGMERRFLTDDGGEVRVIPNVAGDEAFAPIRMDHIINNLIMTNCSRTLTSAVASVEELKKEWIGKPYYKWVHDAKHRPPPLEHTTGPTPAEGITRERELELMRLIADLVSDNYKLRTKIKDAQKGIT